MVTKAVCIFFMLSSLTGYLFGGDADVLTENSWYVLTEVEWLSDPGDVVFQSIETGKIVYKTRYALHYITTFIFNSKDVVQYDFDTKIQWTIRFKDNYNMLIERKKSDPRLLAVSFREGEMVDPERPILGRWLFKDGRFRFENRLIREDDWIILMYLPELPYFAFPEGYSLVKRTGEGTFETDGTFGFDRFRIEIIDEDNLTLTPLFDESPKKGHIGPVTLRRVPEP